MSAIWLETSEDWERIDLAGSLALRIRDGAGPVVEPLPSGHVRASDLCPDHIVLHATQDKHSEQWAIVCRPGACRLNGEPLTSGLRHLVHRDEIVLHNCDRRLVFSTESIATVVEYEGDPKTCPRCRQEIVSGMAIVICPTCKVAHHQTQALPCFRYSEQCAACQRPTSLDSGYSFPPEGW